MSPPSQVLRDLLSPGQLAAGSVCAGRQAPESPNRACLAAIRVSTGSSTRPWCLWRCEADGRGICWQARSLDLLSVSATAVGSVVRAAVRCLGKLESRGGAHLGRMRIDARSSKRLPARSGQCPRQARSCLVSSSHEGRNGVGGRAGRDIIEALMVPLLQPTRLASMGLLASMVEMALTRLSRRPRCCWKPWPRLPRRH